MAYWTCLGPIWFPSYSIKQVYTLELFKKRSQIWSPGTTFRTPKGLNVLLMPKLIHVGSFLAKFGDKIIKKDNFQKWSQIWSPGTTFRTPPGTPKGLNVLLMSKLIHVGSFTTNFGDNIIKKVNFQKWSQIWSPGTTFRTPPGTPEGLNVLLMSKLIHLGSFATNFGDKIIKKVNFSKMVPNWVPWDHF